MSRTKLEENNVKRSPSPKKDKYNKMSSFVEPQTKNINKLNESTKKKKETNRFRE